jgi:prophage DNA circulation protein
MLKQYLAEAEAVIKNLLLAEDSREKESYRKKANQLKVTIAELINHVP